MANYYFDVNPISRRNGGSAAGAAAYRSGMKLRDDFFGKTYDYTRKTGIIHTEIILTPEAPMHFYDRQIFMSAIDIFEKRIDSRLLREVKGSLPNEHTLAENLELVRWFINNEFISLGMCADFSIHEGKHSRDSTKDNPHVHILLTDRPVDSNGFCAKKNRDWNKRSLVIRWREQWAQVQNRAYERKCLDVRVSHESLYVQGVDREPLPYLSRTDWQRERNGIRTKQGDERRAVKARNVKYTEHKRQEHREQERYCNHSR